MADLNSCTFTGRLTKDAIQKTTPQGYELVSFDLANNIGWGDNAKVLYMQVTVWGKLGKTLLPYLQKGKQVGVTGEVEMQTWESKQDGSTQRKLCLKASNVILMAGSGKGDNHVDADVVDDPSYTDVQF